MPLFVDGNLVPSGIKSSSEFIQNYAELKKRSQEFALHTKRSFQDEKILYIGQREYGTAHPSDNSVDVIESDSATTCQIVVFHHPGSGACSLAHFDGSEIAKALAEMVETLQAYQKNSNEKRIEMHIIGGFLDNQNISEEVFMKILDGACQLSTEVHLVCACVCALNDSLRNGQHVPNIYGAAVVVSSGLVIPVQQFECEIPDEILRHVALYREHTDVVQVYTSSSQEVIVRPFQVYCSVANARRITKLPDDIILKSFSTSPHCEPANFPEKLRKAFEFLARHPDIMNTFFPHGKSRKFRRADGGHWYLIDESNL